ncbi:hypothetical protein BG005_000339 [Podila minutissima]|nr:hypothetical protein BG005_000339 [Podila minutissima]
MQFLTVPDAVELFVSGLDATHLDAECPKLVQPSFTLDTAALSQPDLAHVRVIFRHCIIEELVVKGDPIDLSMSNLVAKVLESVQWPLLELLRLSADNINQWIRLLAKIDTPQLKTLQIWGTKSVQREFSHESVLFVERLISTSSLSELYFDDVLLPDQRDWMRLVEKMDLAMLKNTYLDVQFMTTPDALDLMRSKWRQLAEDSEAQSEEDDSEDEQSEGEQSEGEQSDEEQEA